MAGITIGRVGLYDNLELGKPRSWRIDGDRCIVDGRLYDLTVANALWLKRQLTNLLEEPDLVPVTWSGEPKIDGFYRVAAVTVDEPPGSLRHGALNWSVELDRPPWWRTPAVEDYVIGAVITNSHSLTPTNSVCTTIKASQNYALGDSFVVGPENEPDLTGADAISVHRYLAQTGAGALPGVLSYYLAPAGWYDGACQIEVGASKLNLQGRSTDTDPLNWRMSNQLVRVISIANGLRTSVWNGSAWETKDFDLYIDELTGYRVDTWDNMTVLCNTPERVTIRCIVRSVAVARYTATVDVTLLKGKRSVLVVMNSSPGYTRPFGIRMATIEAGTNITSGIRATSNDANGNRYFMMSPAAVTTDTTNGRIRLTTAAVQGVFAVGLELNGSSQTLATEQITGSAGIRDSFFLSTWTVRRAVGV